MVTIPIPHANKPIESARKTSWPWIIVAWGYLFPGIIGICVRQYLESIGKPVMPWSWVAEMSVVLAIFSVIWVLPFVLVALVARRLSLAETKYRGLIYGAFLGTALFELIVFIDAWRNVEAIVLGFLILPVLVFCGTLLGGALGFLVGWLVGRCRR